MTIARDTLRECVKPGRSKEYDEKYSTVFENPDGETHQGGLLKIEGVYRRGYFPGLKNYFLDSELGCEGDSSEPIKHLSSAVFRAKGISQMAQKNLAVEHFKVSVDSNHVHTNTWKLRPQPNMTIGVSPVSRKLNKPLNLKRIFTVSCRFLKWLDLKNLFKLLLFQILEFS